MTIFVPSSPGGYTIFCDDCRIENNGKAFYIGVYNSALVLPGPLPGVLATFAAIATYRERPGESDLPVTLRLFVPGVDAPLFERRLPVEEARARALSSDWPEGEDRMINLVNTILISPLPLPQPGFIKVRAYRGEDEIRMGALEVRATDPAQHTSQNLA